MKRGRPLKSIVREHIKEILFLAGPMTAYEVHKHYVKLFPATTQRNIYYQLRKGFDIGMFEVESVKEEKGDYSWGETATKTYFKLAKDIKPNFSKEVRDYFQKEEANK